MRRFAAVRLRDGLHVLGPAPAGLQHEPTHRASSNGEELDLAVRELARLVGRRKLLVLTTSRLCHDRSPLVTLFIVCVPDLRPAARHGPIRIASMPAPAFHIPLAGRTAMPRLVSSCGCIGDSWERPRERAPAR